MSQIKTVILSVSLFALSGCGGIFSGLDNKANFTSYETLEQQSQNEIGGDTLDDGVTIPGNNPGDDGNNGISQGGGQIGIGGGGDIPPNPGRVDQPTPTPVDCVNDGCTEPGAVTRLPKEDLGVGMETLKKCQAGEIDVIRLSMYCQPNLSLILTLKDADGEELVENFGSGSNGQVNQAIKKLKELDSISEVTGYSFDLFLCLDSDGDGKCTDERVMDLNEMNADLLYSVLAFNKIKGKHKVKEHRAKLRQVCQNDIMTQIEDGLVVFHQMFKDDSVEIPSNDVVASGRRNVHAMTAEEMAKYVKNFSEESEVASFETGTAVNFKLVEADKVSCDKIDIRIHGCYTEGTQIQISDSNSIAIEDLQVGYSVLRSNGTFAKITKIVKGPEKKPVIKLELENGQSVTLTEKHPIVTEAGLVLAKDVSIGTKLLSKDGKWYSLKSMTTHKYDGLVYNVQLDGQKELDHLLLSNGIVTGDLYLQNRLNEKGGIKPVLGLNR